MTGMAGGWQLYEYYRRRIAARMRLRKDVSLDSVLEQIEAAGRIYIREMEAQSALRYKDGEVLSERCILHTTIPYELKPSPKTGRLVSAGAPPKLPTRHYVAAVVKIYEAATGRQLGRLNVEVPDNSEEGSHSVWKPIPFLKVCMWAVGMQPGKYPNGIIQDVLKELHPNVKHGWRKRKRRKQL
jgi:hypothetical protein